MASRLASRTSSAGGAAASTTNQTMTSRTITGGTTAIPTRTSNNTVPPSVVATTNDSVSEMGTGASAVFLNQQRSNDFILTNDQLLGIVSKNVRLDLFHLVKFITSPSELDWGEPIQRWIFQKVNFSEDKSLKEFWAKHCCCVRLALNKKRGNVSTEVKSSFMRMMKEADAAEEDTRPTLVDMLSMGDNENDAYITFCDHILHLQSVVEK
eukprot:scaffold78751_cov52-Attheya_sp.AAC.1